MSDCLTEGDLEEFHSNRMSPAQQDRVRTHLAACANCARRDGEHLANDQILGTLRRRIVVEDRSEASGSALTKTVETHAPPFAGQLPRVEDYEIVREIGRGGMGVVYEAVQRKLNRAVALKILPRLIGTTSGAAVLRFKREALASARLHHTHIIPVYDFGEAGGVYYYAMELVHGCSVAQMLRGLVNADHRSLGNSLWSEVARSANIMQESNPDLPAGTGLMLASPASGAATRMALDGSFGGGVNKPYYRQVATWVADVAMALQFAHDRGVIHRDIKPSNLVLADDGRMMVADFGLAKLDDADSMTITGSLVGTWRYMSPEQTLAKRMPVDHRTDIYSLGATLYEMLAFRPAFDGATEQEIVSQIITQEPKRPRRINPHVPTELETICLKAMDKDPGARYATSREMAADLRRYDSDVPIVARRPSVFVRMQKFTRRHRAWLTGMTAITILSALLIWSTYTTRTQRRANAVAAYRAAWDKFDPGVPSLRNSAFELLEQAVQNDPRNLRYRLQKPRWLLAMGQAGQACDELLKLGGTHHPTLYALLAGCAAQIDPQQAEQYRKQALELDPRMLDRRREEAERARDAGDRRRAIELLTEALYIDPDEPWCLYERAWLFQQEKDLPRAVRDAKRLADVVPESAQAWSVLAEVEKDGGYFREAEGYFKMSERFAVDDLESVVRSRWDLEPVSRVKALNNLARFHKDRRQYDIAEDYCRQAIDADPKYAEAWNTLAVVRKRRGNLAGALEAYQNCLKLEEQQEQWYVWLNIAIVEARQAHWSQAKEHLDRAIELMNEDATPSRAHESLAYYCVAAVDYACGRVDDALDRLAQAIAVSDDHAPSRRMLSDIYLHVDEHRNVRLALDSAAQAVRQRRHDPRFLQTSALAYLRNGRYREADIDARAALQLLGVHPELCADNPAWCADDPVSRLCLAYALLQQEAETPEEAQERYREAQENYRRARARIDDWPAEGIEMLSTWEGCITFVRVADARRLLEDVERVLGDASTDSS